MEKRRTPASWSPFTSCEKCQYHATTNQLSSSEISCFLLYEISIGSAPFLRLRARYPKSNPKLLTGEKSLYMFCTCSFATLVQHPAAPVRHFSSVHVWPVRDAGVFSGSSTFVPPALTERGVPLLRSTPQPVGNRTIGRWYRVATKLWAIPSSNCAAHFVLAQWWQLKVDLWLWSPERRFRIERLSSRDCRWPGVDLQ
jgi:hypothetical protein